MRTGYVPNPFTTGSTGVSRIEKGTSIVAGQPHQSTTSKMFEVIKTLALATTIVVSTVSPRPISTTSTAQWITKATKESASINTYTSQKNENFVDHSDTGLLTHRSFELQKAFGFTKKAQWAAVLNVERKTIYDWQKNPETNVHSRIAERIQALISLHDEMTDTHRIYLARFSYGKNADTQLAKEILEDPLDIEKLKASYDRLFVDIDGVAKRSLLGVA